MSLDGTVESARERLLAEVYAQPHPLDPAGEATDPGARDRARAVDRVMREREAQRRRARRPGGCPWARAAVLLLCALGYGTLAGRSGPDAPPMPAPRLEIAAAADPSVVVSLDPPPAPLPETAQAAPLAPGERPASSALGEELHALARSREEALRLAPVPAGPFEVEPVELPGVAGELAEIAVPAPTPLQLAPPVAEEAAVADAPVETAAPALLDLPSPISIAPPSAERLRELQLQRGNDIAEVLPALGPEKLGTCVDDPRVGAAAPTQEAATRDELRCPDRER